jgi:hypothetical protein
MFLAREGEVERIVMDIGRLLRHTRRPTIGSLTIGV